MFKSIWSDVKREYTYGNMVTRLVIANTAVFLAIWVVSLVYIITLGFQGDYSVFQDKVVRFLSFSTDWKHIITHPWGIFTYMFVHAGILHFIFNMLWLYWFGKIVQDFIGNHRILPIYILGGLAGGLVFFISMILIVGPFAFVHGASAGVMAMVFAAATLSPDYELRLLFLGNVKLKYIAFAALVIDIIFVAQQSNTGGHFAHMGGAFMGWLFVYRLRTGYDLSLPINNFINKITSLFSPKDGKKKSKLSVRYKNEAKIAGEVEISDQDKLDNILEKIKQSGIDSLSTEEREFLFQASQK